MGFEGIIAQSVGAGNVISSFFKSMSGFRLK